MHGLKAVGAGAAAKKYDILSAMMAMALHKGGTDERRILRLMSLITTRYNWRTETLVMGQAEIARLWDVDTRTVKREMAVFRDLGWIVVKRAGARGRVGAYGINFDRILKASAPFWPAIGSDFEDRAVPMIAAPDPTVIKVNFAKPTGPGAWPEIAAMLAKDNAEVYQNWISKLAFKGIEGTTLVLAAPSEFLARYVGTHHQTWILRVARQADPTLTSLRLDCD